MIKMMRYMIMAMLLMQLFSTCALAAKTGGVMGGDFFSDSDSDDDDSSWSSMSSSYEQPKPYSSHTPAYTKPTVPQSPPAFTKPTQEEQQRDDDHVDRVVEAFPFMPSGWTPPSFQKPAQQQQKEYAKMGSSSQSFTRQQGMEGQKSGNTEGRSSVQTQGGKMDAAGLVFFCLVIIFIVVLCCSIGNDKDTNTHTYTPVKTTEAAPLVPTGTTSVIKLQVALLGSARTIQIGLNRIALTADTSTREGIRFILTETLLALQRHPEFCISAHSFVNTECKKKEGEQLFRKLSFDERHKFDEETLVNENSVKRRNTKSTMATDNISEYIVVTVLVAAKGVHKLPTMIRRVDLEDALKMLGEISPGKIMAVQIIWSPQDGNDTLSQKDLNTKYPHLRLLEELQT